MGGASAEVRAHADAVTGAVEHDGAAAVMRAILER
jgi:hydroxymethylpyrimidine pyrophosphatase-like HAD family hydrolase